MRNDKIGVLHLVDSLVASGAESVAVMLANNLPTESYRAYLCASRQSGPLQQRLQPHVTFLDLRRVGRFDFGAIWRLAQYTRREKIQIIHAHATSLFLGAVITLLNPAVCLVWHDHFGRQEFQSRPSYIFRPFARRVRAVFSVTRALAAWSVQALHVPKERVHYLPNFVEVHPPSEACMPLAGTPGLRVVCVANVREQKDHLTLVRAWGRLVRFEPHAHLILVGAETDWGLAEQVKGEIKQLGLNTNLTWLGPRDDIPMVLAHCNIGVLSSISEGFPLVLLEYGHAGLAVVATRVGECAEILEDGNAGILVPPANPDLLAMELLRLLNSPVLQSQLGERLKVRVKQNYSAEFVIQQVCKVYEQILQ
jgi:glycosyltransferase involved in cell wall biosynthesis